MTGSDDTDAPTPRLNVEGLTWTALLAQCVALAQAAVALPDPPERDERAGATEGVSEATAWRASVPHVIELQALWFALRRSERLPADQRALDRDRAAVALGRHGPRLEAIWRPVGQMPDSVKSLIADVRHEIEG